MNNKSSTLTKQQCICNGHIAFVIYTPLVMAQDQTEHTRKLINYGSFIMLYCHLQHHNDTIIKTHAGRLLYKFMYLSLYCKGSKGNPKFACERELETEKKLQYFDPHSYGRQRCVFLVLQMLNRRPRGPLCWVMAFFTASYQQLVWSPNSIEVPEGPFGRVWFSLPRLVYNSISNCLELPLDFCLDWVI